VCCFYDTLQNGMAKIRKTTGLMLLPADSYQLRFVIISAAFGHGLVFWQMGSRGFSRAGPIGCRRHCHNVMFLFFRSGWEREEWKVNVFLMSLAFSSRINCQLEVS
jgi:hypothetical protein